MHQLEDNLVKWLLMRLRFCCLRSKNRRICANSELSCQRQDATTLMSSSNIKLMETAMFCFSFL